MGISVSQLVTRVIPAAINPIRFFESNNATVMPASAFQMWIGNGATFEYTLYIRLVPIELYDYLQENPDYKYYQSLY